MKITRISIVRLLTALGRTDSADWALFTLESRINDEGILSFISNRELPNLDRENDALLALIVEKQSQGEKIEIEDFKDTRENALTEEQLTQAVSETESKTNGVAQDVSRLKRKKRKMPKSKAKTKKKRKAKKPSKEERIRQDRLPWDQRLEIWRRNPMKLTDRGIGITRFVILQLRRAGKEQRPLTKEDLLKMLKANFKRPLKSMRVTLANLLGSRLEQQYGIRLQKTAGWAAGKPRAYSIKPTKRTRQKAG